MLEENPKAVVQSRAESILSAVSLFSGTGGMDIGVIQAGFDVLACVEIDPHCCETLRAAVIREQRRTRIIEDDIRTIEPVNLMHDLCMEPGDLDLLCGGPPCQAFSQIGKRQCLEDDRGMLLFEMTRFAEVFRPKVILIEQVKGLLNAPDRSGKIGGVFELLLERLQALDYVPKWRLSSPQTMECRKYAREFLLLALSNPTSLSFLQPRIAPVNKHFPYFPCCLTLQWVRLLRDWVNQNIRAVSNQTIATLM